MIDCKDLRVGNWIRFNSHTYVQVFEINSDDNTCNGLDLSNDDFHEPILLTPELLVKYGFGIPSELAHLITTVSTRIKSFGDITFNILIDIDGEVSIDISSGDFYFNFIHILYLHQLQNLIYTLTGKELEIDLK